MHRCQDAKRHGLLRFELLKKIDKFLSLNFRNILISPLEGEKKFLSEFCELRNIREGFNLKYSCRNSNFDRRLYFLRNINYNSDMSHHDKNYKGRLGILAQREAGFEPSLLSGEGIDSVVSFALKPKNLTTHENNLPCKELSALVPQYLSNFSDTVFSRFTSHFLRKCTAFTLAEVLITLGIIGIVAAITLPTIINNYRVKVLENQFRKADSLLQQAFRKSVNELGYTDVSEFTIPGSPTHQYFTQEKWAQLQVEAQELNKIWLSQFKIIKTVTWDEKYHKGIKCYNFFGKVLPGHWGCFQTAYMLADGMSIRPVSAQYGGINHPGQITFEFDTNGPYKGPNRMGYDIFVYYSYENYDKDCNPKIISSENYKGCYYWAHRNMSPKDNSKPYWDVLYKPLSYWNK